MSPPSTIHTRALVGMFAPSVVVETHLPQGVVGTTLVGLPEAASRHARDRVRSAILSCGFSYPQQKVVVNLAPAELLKEGARFDLAIALSILKASHQLSANTDRFEFLGELGLFGDLRPVRGALCAALAITREGNKRTLIAAGGNNDLDCAPDGTVKSAAHLRDVVSLLSRAANPLSIVPRAPPAVGKSPGDAIKKLDRAVLPAAEPVTGTGKPLSSVTRVNNRKPATPAIDGLFADIVGQSAGKRALAIAAAGGHHLLMVGPPGTGKTMLARALAELLPPLTDGEAMEVAAVYSAAGLTPPAYGLRPFRDPHHSATAPALVGGGALPTPGEITLAHFGVLFLDEVPHFRPDVLNHLREPIETGSASIVRASYRVKYPCRFQLIAAMNPCPAGRSCREDACRCEPSQKLRYQARVSGPLLDRIDLHVQVPEVPAHLLTRAGSAQTRQAGVEATRQLQTTINAARQAQHKRAMAQRAENRVGGSGRRNRINAELSGREILRSAAMSVDVSDLLARASERYRLSARSLHKVAKVARTIADLEGVDSVGAEHVSEALSFRSLDWDRGV